MAYQHLDKRKGAQINRTPAPDEITDIRRPGVFSPGTNGAQPSSVAPGQASESILAQNLREGQTDGEDVLSKVIAGGVSGRGDDIPADGNDQLRQVSATPYPSAFGHQRQQDPNFWHKKSDGK